MSKLFRPGGPHEIRQTGPDQYSMSISLPQDSDGRIARACPDKACSPGTFKLKLGTGLSGPQASAFCPYCRREAEPSDFATEDQSRYARDVMMGEVHAGMDRMMRDALNLGPSGKRELASGLISVELSYKPAHRNFIRRPSSERVRRDLVCPHCGLDHSVFGLALWCPDCGVDIFLTHVDAEFEVIGKMIVDIDRREELLGIRVAMKDLENCLEDIVSTVEAVLRLIYRRRLKSAGIAFDEIGSRIKRIRNAFQNISQTREIYLSELSFDPFSVLSEEEQTRLALVFEKRNPITHNLGVVDRKYLERAQTAEREGREILVDQLELVSAIKLSKRVLENAYTSSVATDDPALGQ